MRWLHSCWLPKVWTPKSNLTTVVTSRLGVGVGASVNLANEAACVSGVCFSDRAHLLSVPSTNLRQARSGRGSSLKYGLIRSIQVPVQVAKPARTFAQTNMRTRSKKDAYGSLPRVALFWTAS